MTEQTETPSITCPVCGMTSYHPMDKKYGWCGNCNDYTSPPYCAACASPDDCCLMHQKHVTPHNGCLLR